MAEDKPNGQIAVTPEFRMAYPNLFEPRAFKKNGKETGDKFYDLTMIFDKPEDMGPDDKARFDALKAAAVAVAKAKWPDRDLKSLKFPFRDGTKIHEKAKERGKKNTLEPYKDKIILKVKTKKPPVVADENKNQDIIDQKIFYSGAYGYAEVNLVAYEGVDENPDGVTAYLNAVMKSRDGERILQRTAKDIFDGVEGGQSQEDPTVGADDDEIPF